MEYLSRVRRWNHELNDRFFPRTQPRYTDWFRQQVRSLSEGAHVVVHLGAGSVSMEPFLNASNPRARLINLDLRYEELRGNPGALRVCADAEALPFPDEDVDLICSEHVFEHIPRPLVCLKECFRVLKAGGRLLVSGPNGWSYIALAARLSSLSFHDSLRHLARGARDCPPNGFPTFYRFNTLRKMRRLAWEAGFEVVSVETFVGEPCYTVFLPLVHLGFIGFHLALEKLRPIFNIHITSVVVFEKRCHEQD